MDYQFLFQQYLNNIVEFFNQKLAEMEAFQDAQAQEINDLANKLVIAGLIVVALVITLIIVLICVGVSRSRRRKRKMREMEEQLRRQERMLQMQEEQRLRAAQQRNADPYYGQADLYGQGGPYGHSDVYSRPEEIYSRPEGIYDPAKNAGQPGATSFKDRVFDRGNSRSNEETQYFDDWDDRDR